MLQLNKIKLGLPKTNKQTNWWSQFYSQNLCGGRGKNDSHKLYSDLHRYIIVIYQQIRQTKLFLFLFGIFKISNNSNLDTSTMIECSFMFPNSSASNLKIEITNKLWIRVKNFTWLTLEPTYHEIIVIKIYKKILFMLMICLNSLIFNKF